MKTAFLHFILLALLPVMSLPGAPNVSSDEPVVGYTTISVHTVQQGTMPFHTKGRGMISRIGPNARTRVLILLSFARNLKIGDPASVKIVGIGGSLPAKVTDIGALDQDQVLVEMSFDQSLPQDVRAGDSADALIEYGRIENTLYMERGFFDTANADVPVFRVDPDKKHATRVTVHFGAIASELIEIKSGLQEGDKVIVTDVNRWIAYERIRLE